MDSYVKCIEQIINRQLLQGMGRQAVAISLAVVNTRGFLNPQHEGQSERFRTDAVKFIKLTIRPIGRHHPRSSFLPHVDTGPTVSIFGTLPGSHFLSECQGLSAIWPGSPHWYQTGVLSASISFLEIGKSHRGAKSGECGGWGMTAILRFARNYWVRTEV
jgi:hypothetical protein